MTGTTQDGYELDGFYNWDGVTMANERPLYAGEGHVSEYGVWFDGNIGNDGPDWTLGTLETAGSNNGWIASNGDSQCPSNVALWAQYDEEAQSFPQDPNLSVGCVTGKINNIKTCIL